MPGTGTTITEDAPSTLRDLTLSSLRPHPKNRPSGLGALEELSDSIKASGILQPLIVVPETAKGKYRIIAGHRRHAAAKTAGLKHVPCIVRTDLDDEADQLAAMINENGPREGLTILDEAAAVQGLIDLGDSVRAAADRTGMSQRRIRERVKIANAPESVKTRVVEHQISLEDAVFVASHYDDEEDRALIDAYLGTSNWEWAKSRLRELVAARKKINAVRKAAEKAGVPVVESIQERDRLIAASDHTTGKYIDTTYPVPGRDDLAAEDTIIEIVPPSHAAGVAMIRVFELHTPAPESDTSVDRADGDTTPGHTRDGLRPVEGADDEARQARIAAQEENKRIHADLLTAAAVRRQFLTQQTTSGDTAGAIAALKATIYEFAIQGWLTDMEVALLDLDVEGVDPDARTAVLCQWVSGINDLAHLAWIISILYWICNEHADLGRERRYEQFNPYSLDPEEGNATRLIGLLNELGYQWSDVERDLLEKAAAATEPDGE